VHAPGLDDPLLVVKRDYTPTTQAWYQVVSDGQGELIALADSAGQLQGTFLNSPQYDAGIWNSSGLTGRATSFDPRRQATAGPIDTISTFRSRQYDPSTGKWLQEDHAGIAGGVNLYEYNGNDPNSFRDPVGDCPTNVGGNGKTTSYADCPKGTKGFDMIGAVESPTIDPLAIVVVGVGGIIANAFESAATMVTGAAEKEAATATRVAGRIAGYTKHGLNQAISREGKGVSAKAILDAVRNPTSLVEQSGNRLRMIGSDAAVLLNAAGKIITTWATNGEGLRAP
jgi:RHS repeat-associated protein